MYKRILIGLLLVASLGSSVTKAENPIIQTAYTADPAPMIYNGTVYLYTSHDEDVTVNNFFSMNDWRCYSSTDMLNWTDHGAILSYKTFEWSRGDAWAGQCIARNGKFYYYLPVNEKNGGNAIGVAVADSPTGPFKDALGKPLLRGFGYIDPTVYIDNDGQAWLYWGNPNLWHVKLNEDMISYDQTTGIVKEDLQTENFGYRANKINNRSSSYEEGPWFFRRNARYYMLYAAGGVPEHLAYSTSASPTGPWKYGDTIMHVIGKNGAFTNHPGYVEFNGKSYFFYHNAGLPGGGGFKRSVCIEPFTFNADGSIPRINPSTQGVTEGVVNVNPYQRTEAETMAWSVGIKTSSDPQSGVYVTQISNDDCIKVSSVDFGKGAKSFRANVAATKPGAVLEIRLDAKNGKLIGTMPVKPSSGNLIWSTQKCSVSPAKGVHDLYFIFKGTGDDLFNFDWWQFL